MLSLRVSVIGTVVVTLVVAAAAQTPSTPQSKEMVVGLSLYSNYARIADFLPRLRDSLVKQHRKQVRLVALDGNPQDAEDEAKDKACEYLLQLNVLAVAQGRWRECFRHRHRSLLGLSDDLGCGRFRDHSVSYCGSSNKRDPGQVAEAVS